MGLVAGMVSEVIPTGRTLDGSFVNNAARDSTRELEIIEKFLHPHCLLVHKVQICFNHLVFKNPSSHRFSLFHITGSVDGHLN